MEDGLSICRNEKIECILLDFNFNALNGISFIETLSDDEKLRMIPIIIFTAQGYEDIAANAIKLGAKDFIVKSNLTYDKLLRTISKVLYNAKNELKIKEQQDKIFKLAYYDPLTFIMNRRSFEDTLQKYIASARRRKQLVGLLFLDLDNFKMVNDTLGHGKGDELLKLVADKISSQLRNEDLFSRFGGDEFLIALKDIQHVKDAAHIAEKILKQINNHIFRLGNESAYISASIGIAVYPKDANSAHELLKCADLGMYLAKKCGKNNYCYYSPSLQEDAKEKTCLEKALREAIQSKEIYLAFQPQYDLTTYRMIGIEVLARWTHPTLGPISPDKFILIAEEMGLMQELGHFILEQALSSFKNILDEINQKIIMSINVSSKELLSKDYFKSVQSAIVTNNIKPGSIEIEITEVDMIDNSDAIQTIRKLRNFGIRVSIDDFGTGYSTLLQLNKIMPIDTIKVDRSFVMGLVDNPNDLRVIKSIIDIAENFNLNVIGEGIETKQQLDTLLSLGCQQAQGFYFSKPIALTDVITLINKINNK
jgi:diguanylate cyclase (GGDEF)-like protein